MKKYHFEERIKQLEKRRGGYFYLTLSAATVDKLSKKRLTRIRCSVNGAEPFSCGLNHLGDGNFFIIVGKDRMEEIGVQLNQLVGYEIHEDPNPLGVSVPEVLEALLEQDAEIKSIYDSITDGKKRSLIFSINRIKNIDLQIEKSLAFFKEQKFKKNGKGKH